MAAVDEHDPELVSLELGLPPAQDGAEEGVQALEEIVKRAPATKIVVVTGNGDRINAIRAIQLGAFDYRLKPIDLDGLKVVLGRAAYLRALAELHARERRYDQAISVLEAAARGVAVTAGGGETHLLPEPSARRKSVNGEDDLDLVPRADGGSVPAGARARRGRAAGR
jgi:DNA-binding NarL/FixJ family response regulator